MSVGLGDVAASGADLKIRLRDVGQLLLYQGHGIGEGGNRGSNIRVGGCDGGR